MSAARVSDFITFLLDVTVTTKRKERSPGVLAAENLLIEGGEGDGPHGSDAKRSADDGPYTGFDSGKLRKLL
jgi:hypothetical protein